MEMKILEIKNNKIFIIELQKKKKKRNQYLINDIKKYLFHFILFLFYVFTIILFNLYIIYLLL